MDEDEAELAEKFFLTFPYLIRGELSRDIIHVISMIRLSLRSARRNILLFFFFFFF